MKIFPDAFKLTDNQQVIFEFEKLLCNRGLPIIGTPVEEASLAIVEMLEISKNKAIYNKQIDCREKWRQAFFLADMARKILRAQQRPNFNTLLPHLKLLLKPGNFSQFSACKMSASPKEKEINNKMFELYVAAILFQICSDLRLDNPNLSKGDNPDVIGEYNSKKWAFACKASHSSNPLAFLQRVRDGIDQIEVAKVDQGIVVINLKNLIPHNEIWPAFRDPQNGEWDYGAYPFHDAPVILIRILFRQFEQSVYDLVGGRQAFINEFTGKKAIPVVLMFYCSVTGHAPQPGIVVPMIVKQMAGIGLPTEQLDLNSGYGKLVDLFNDYLHDRLN